MKLYLTPPDHLAPGVVVLGMFDGVHKGHRQLLETARAFARRDHLPVYVLTFQRHPLQVLRPQIAPPMLTTLPQRARLMACAGVDALFALPFTLSTANESPEDFLTWLIATFSPRHLVAGFNYSFGKGGRGDGAMLSAWGERWGYETHIVPPVTYAGENISSSRIRKLIQQGEMALANFLLGSPYALSGRVEQGKHVGRTMGFPTANLPLPKERVIPAYGVYAAWLHVEGKRYPAVLNVGRHPTLPEGSATIEAHVMGETVNLYGKKVRIEFLNFQRGEKRFESVEALKAQIAQDKQEALAWFQNNSKEMLKKAY